MSEEKKTCEHCGKELDEDEVYESLDGQTLCYDCYMEEEDLRFLANLGRG